MKLTNNNLQKIIFDIVTQTFLNLKEIQFDGEGIIATKDEQLAESNRVNIIHFEKRSIVQVDPGLGDNVNKFVDESLKSKAIVAEDFKTIFSDKHVEIDSPIYMNYLVPENLAEIDLEEGFTIRQMSKEDLKYLEELKSDCNKEELPEGLIEIDYDVIFGCFYKDKLVAASRLFFWGDTFADIGVYTHPEFRRKGLGKSIVGSICKWGIDNNRILQYRCEESDERAYNLAKSVGFTKVIKQEFIMVNKYKGILKVL